MARLNVGVDIGSTSVRGVQIKIQRGNISVIRAAEVPLTKGTVVAGEVRNIEDLSNTINELWKVGKFTTKNVTVGLASQQILVRELSLPWEEPILFRQALPIRIGDAFGISPKELILDYHPIEVYAVGDLIQQKALIVGAQAQAAENIADALTLSKLRVRRADFAPFALIRAAMATSNKGLKDIKKNRDDANYEAVIDVGGQITLISIHKNGLPLYVRIIPAGADAVTKALADNLGMRLELAEALKRHMGMQGAESGAVKSPFPKDVPDEVIPDAQLIMNSMAGHLVQEVRSTVEYFLTLFPDLNNISRVLLSGGGSMIPGYAERIASELRAPTAFLAPMHAFSKDKKIKLKDPNMSIAFGLALEVK